LQLGDTDREQKVNHRLTRRDFLLASMGLGAGLFVLGPGGRTSASPLETGAFAEAYPKALFLHPSFSRLPSDSFTYENWEKRYLPLDGIVGKVLNEEHDYSTRNNLQWFLNYKQAHPEKMVLLHYNGTGRRATDEATTRFFAGHFLYYRGTKLTRGIKSQTQDVLHVEDTSVFNMRRYRKGVEDDIAIARVGTDGKPRWGTAEQVRLRSIDAANKTITVQRGNYGTRARKFSRGSYLAAHVTTGPYRLEDTPEQNIPLWAYNLSTECPRDGEGRNCGDALADYLGEKLGSGGELSSFDGITLDVFSWIIGFGHPLQEIDVNTDGSVDEGIVGGVNTVSKGVLAFLQALRERLGPDKLILSDGHILSKSQRGFEILNGAESEGYPDKQDIGLDHLSRGENIFNYWEQNSAPRSFNYMNFRYKQTRPERWRNTFIEPNLSEDESYRKLRLALASALFTDSALASGGLWLPPEVHWEAGGVKVRVFDELWKGKAQERHWLGQPLGEAVHLATRKADDPTQEAPDHFEGHGESWPETFIGRFAGEGVSFSGEVTEQTPILVVSSTGSTGPLSFTLPGIDIADQDLFVSLRLRAEPLDNFPTSVPRRVDVWAVAAGGVASQVNGEFTWAGSEPFEASLYYKEVGPGTIDLKFEVEGNQPLYLLSMKAHSAADARYREYENGVVFANPSTREYTFDVGLLFEDLLASGVTLRRIDGSDNQDPLTNDGSALGQQLTLPAKDALFVEKVQPPPDG
jgi:hypothetical protein